MFEVERQKHKVEVERYLMGRFGNKDWTLELPHGSGQETYIAQGDEGKLFVKLGSEVERVRAMAEAGLAPDVVDAGVLEDGTVIVVQEWVEGWHPGRDDYAERLEDVAHTIGAMHRNERVKAALPGTASERFAAAGLSAVEGVRERWELVKEHASSVAGFVDDGLAELEERISQLKGEGLVASHNDICRDNWLFTPDGRIYIVDLDMMGPDDPALDIGITLWWYFAPEMWERFIKYAGYEDNEAFRERMWARIALHCLSITLPRPGSFDQFDAKAFPGRLRDFRAALLGMGNPEI